MLIVADMVHHSYHMDRSELTSILARSVTELTCAPFVTIYITDFILTPRIVDQSRLDEIVPELFAFKIFI